MKLGATPAGRGLDALRSVFNRSTLRSRAWRTASLKLPSG
jgi:hypothetical protein